MLHLDFKRDDIHSYFITAKGRYEINKLHLCSWLFKDGAEFLECGLEVARHANDKEIELKVWVPWIKAENVLQDLYISLKESANAKFIFNDSVQSAHFFEDGDKSGTAYDFASGNKLTILPCNLVAGNGFVTVKMKLPSETTETKIGERIYCRFLAKTTTGLFSFQQQGISKAIYTYDLKVNEPRNCPENLNQGDDPFCTIKTVFCLHIIPSDFALSFLSQKSFKSVRILEKGSYEKYADKMTDLPKIADKDLLVVFNKLQEDSSYSFFSVFERESIGNSQVIMAISLNILVSSFFFLLPIVTKVRDIASISWKMWTYIPLGLCALAIVDWVILREQVKPIRYVVYALACLIGFLMVLIIFSR